MFKDSGEGHTNYCPLCVDLTAERDAFQLAAQKAADEVIALRIECDRLTAAIAEANARAVIPEGWRAVPVEPTEEMLSRISDVIASGSNAWAVPEHAWHYINEAAPTPPAQDDTTEADARRYRWLRDSESCGAVVFVYEPTGQYARYLDATKIDAAIDAAMAKETK